MQPIIFSFKCIKAVAFHMPCGLSIKKVSVSIKKVSVSIKKVSVSIKKVSVKPQKKSMKPLPAKEYRGYPQVYKKV
ncbi:hypothetical protein K4R26_11550 [Staphylococcus epidermidis]|nr:hypothetical protein [Staphylococcus epidermidis]